MTEQKLEEKNVTKGARHKIIVNIDKLRARQSNVIAMEKCVEHEGISGLRQCLNELKNMLITPIKAFESDRGKGHLDFFLFSLITNLIFVPLLNLQQQTESKDTNGQEIAEGDLPSQIMRLLEKGNYCSFCSVNQTVL